MTVAQTPAERADAIEAEWRAAGPPAPWRKPADFLPELTRLLELVRGVVDSR